MSRRERARRTTHWLASRMLSYPDATLLGELDAWQHATSGAPRGVRPDLLRFLGHVRGTPLPGLEDEYVRTFDTKSRHCLHLTSYSCPDASRRGAALTEFERAYARAGVSVRESEDQLPDHLAVVLRFSAAGDGTEADRLLAAYRPGIESLRHELDSCGSPYADVLRAVCATLPDDEPVAGEPLPEGHTEGHTESHPESHPESHSGASA